MSSMNALDFFQTENGYNVRVKDDFENNFPVISERAQVFAPKVMMGHKEGQPESAVLKFYKRMGFCVPESFTMLGKLTTAIMGTRRNRGQDDTYFLIDGENVHWHDFFFGRRLTKEDVDAVFAEVEQVMNKKRVLAELANLTRELMPSDMQGMETALRVKEVWATLYKVTFPVNCPFTGSEMGIGLFMMVPAIPEDGANPNVECIFSAGMVVIKALRPIKKGEVLRRAPMVYGPPERSPHLVLSGIWSNLLSNEMDDEGMEETNKIMRELVQAQEPFFCAINPQAPQDEALGDARASGAAAEMFRSFSTGIDRMGDALDGLMNLTTRLQQDKPGTPWPHRAAHNLRLMAYYSGFASLLLGKMIFTGLLDEAVDSVEKNQFKEFAKTENGQIFTENLQKLRKTVIYLRGMMVVEISEVCFYMISVLPMMGSFPDEAFLLLGFDFK